MVRKLNRRELLGAGAGVAGAATLGPGFLAEALAAPARAGRGPYGPLLAPDANGIQLPAGFRSREIARGLEPVPGTAYVLPVFPDGQATFRTGDGGWILVTNSESLASVGAGVSAIRFSAGGEVVAAQRILGGTNVNCAGGPTPWGTWLSGEEVDDGLIWECDPTGMLEPLPRPALGVFKHEAAAVDPVSGHVYLTEDEGDGGFYRFVPSAYPSLEQGRLEVAVAGSAGAVEWKTVPDPTTTESGVPTREQVPAVTRFKGGEGIWYSRGVCYFTTKGDRKVWSYEIDRRRLRVLYDHARAPEAALDAVDNVTVSAAGDVLVCEDGGNLEIGLISPRRIVSPVIRLPGEEHAGSELCGVCFDPSGTRMYFTSQRGPRLGADLPGPGAIYEVEGPWRMPATGSSADFTYGPPAGELRPKGPLNPGPDRGKPALGVQVPARIGADRLIDQGLRVRVKPGEAVRLAVALTSFDLERDRDERDLERPRPTRLARVGGVRAERGETVKLRLRPEGPGRKLLAAHGGEAIEARLVVVARDGAGNRRIVTRRVIIRG